MYEAFKPLGALSIVLGWASMLFLIYKWRGDKSMSFSGHAASHPTAYFMMAIMESAFLPMYLLFIATWFVHSFELGPLFTLLNAISVVGLLIAAWVPYRPGRQARIHHQAAHAAYSCMIFAMICLTLSPTVPTVARLMSFIALLDGLYSAYLLYIKPNGRDHLLYIQGIFMACVHLSILTATYIS